MCIDRHDLTTTDVQAFILAAPGDRTALQPLTLQVNYTDHTEWVKELMSRMRETKLYPHVTFIAA